MCLCSKILFIVILKDNELMKIQKEGERLYNNKPKLFSYSSLQGGLCVYVDQD